jgi:predicted glycogen debranching enzyme
MSKKTPPQQQEAESSGITAVEERSPLSGPEMDLRLSWDPDKEEAPEELLRREWLLTNGLGGYASGTLAGIPTRRYHGLLIAALANPFGRQLFFNHLTDVVVFPDGAQAFLSTGITELAEPGIRSFRLVEFRLETGLPVWRYRLDSVVIERKIFMLHEQNTIHIEYRLIAGPDNVVLRLHPAIHFRPHEETPAVMDLSQRYSLRQSAQRMEITANGSELPPLRLVLLGAENDFMHQSRTVELLYREEKNRGYAADGSLWTPGYFQMALAAGQPGSVYASTESWETVLAHGPREARNAEITRRKKLIESLGRETLDSVIARLVLAADQFVITPSARVDEAARARAIGEQARSVIAGYHWFTDWGRDTMISLEGLTLATARESEARFILHTFSLSIRNGLIPNLFPEGERTGLYHTADATLWYFHALSRYLQTSGDSDTLRALLPRLVEILRWHIQGTDFGIGMDTADGLLRQGQEGYQLTWMDAKVDDWVVTPRRGKAVEINALWYNALRLAEEWLHDHGDNAQAAEFGELAGKVFTSFNRRFWNEEQGFLLDVVDGESPIDDEACRPNQIFAVSLPHAVLQEERWQPVLGVVEERLLTPVGLRSLAPGHPSYRATYTGDLRSRDAAYHQGTVWAWLIGPFVDAWMKVHPNEPSHARIFLSGLVEHLSDAGVGSVSEIFDAEAPYTPRGCIAQAWSVAELLRCLRKISAAEQSTA